MAFFEEEKRPDGENEKKIYSTDGTTGKKTKNWLGEPIEGEGKMRTKKDENSREEVWKIVEENRERELKKMEKTASDELFYYVEKLQNRDLTPEERRDYEKKRDKARKKFEKIFTGRVRTFDADIAGKMITR